MGGINIKSKLLFVVLVLFVLISLNCVNASDNDTMINEPLENNQITEVIGNFTDLNGEISEIPTGGNLTLKKDYSYNSSDSDYKNGILIAKDNIVIDGDGHTINGENQARIFNITANNVTLKNINFVNGYSNDNGGAIFAIHNLNMLNCHFENNHAKSGGAIYFYGNGMVINSNFTNNSVRADDSCGGAIHFYGNGTVIGSKFVNNTGGYYGGAVYIWMNGTIEDSIFDSNEAQNGGSVYIHGAGEVNNCNFINNKARTGGAIEFWNVGIVKNSTFNSNVGRYGGGAIYSNNDIKINDSDFENNSVIENAGGALNVYGNAELNCCNFTSNSASSYGGAVSTNYTKINNSNFISNSASTAGAIMWKGDNGAVSGCSFMNNSANYAGAIRGSGNNGTVSGCTFENNRAKNDGGAIVWSGNGGTVSGCTFENNSANQSGGAVFWNRSTGDISSSVFINNHADDGAVYFYNMYGIYRLAVNGNIFLNNNASAIVFAMRDSSSNADYNWFGHNATNYDTKPILSNVTINKWLFLEGTADPVVIFESCDVFFILYSYDSTHISYYDNSRLYPINLTVVATSKGESESIAKLGEALKYTSTEVGTGSVTVKFENVECTVETTILKANPHLSVGQQEVIYSNNTIVALNYNSTATGKVNITVKGEKSEYAFENLDLNATISLGNLDVGEYAVFVVYSGDDIFTDETAMGTLSVDKADSILNVGDVTLDYGTGSTITVTTEGVITIVAKINGNEVFIKSNAIMIPVLNVGTYNLTITAIPDVNHNAVNKTVTITVNKAKTEIAANAIATTYNINKKLVVTLKDSNGKPLSGVKVTVNLNGAKTFTTDKNGQIKVSTKGLAPKAYAAKITFRGNANYYKSTKKVKITVKKAKPKIIAKKKTFKKAKKVKKYAITLKDNMGKPIKKAKVTLKIKGKTFKAKTNAKGKATFKIKKLTKKGTFKAIITFKGNAFYNKVTKKVKIKMK